MKLSQRFKTTLLFILLNSSKLMYKVHMQSFRFRDQNHREIRKIILSLNKYGYAILENHFNDELITRMRIDNIEKLTNHETKFDNGIESRLFASERSIVSNQIFSNDLMIGKIGQIYLGMSVKNIGCMANIVRPDENAEVGSGGDWHRDSWFPQFKAMMYLTDVEVCGDGAFEVLAGTHKLRSKFIHIKQFKHFGLRFNSTEVETRMNDKDRRFIPGKSGTILMFDSSSIHRGSPNFNQDRVAITNYYYQRIFNIKKLEKKYGIDIDN